VGSIQHKGKIMNYYILIKVYCYTTIYHTLNSLQ
jgi:hypothetical protein